MLELAEKIGAPIIKPLLGKAVVPDDSAYTTGGIGLLGTAPSQEALAECDTLLIAGSGFPYLEFYPKPGQAKGIQIDIDPARIGLRFDVDVGLVGRLPDGAARAHPAGRSQARIASFLKDAQDRMKDWRELMKERGTRTDMPMKPQVVTYHLNKLLDDDAIVSADSGTIATWAARYIDMRDRMQFSLSGSLATMANGLPYSIGAAVAYPKRQVVCVVGDGGFTMLMGEVATLVKYDLRVKVIIIKNNVLGDDQVGADGARGQSGVRRRAAADRLRGVRQGVRRGRLHDRAAGGRRENSDGGAGASGAGGGAGGGRSERAADARQDHDEAGDALRRGARPRARRTAGTSSRRYSRTRCAR